MKREKLNAIKMKNAEALGGSGKMNLRTLVRSAAIALAVAVVTQIGWGIPAYAKSRTLVLKFAEVQPAQGIYGRYEKKFAKLVDERTHGAVKVEIFAGGSLGGEKDVMESLRVGTVQVSLIGLTLMPFLDDTWGPYIFRNPDQATHVLQGPIGQQWKERVFKESGGRLRLLDYVYFGRRELTTRNTPVYKLSDLKGLKIRVMEAPIYIAAWRALGANPVPMAWPEVFTALQQGTIDAQENPYELILSQHLYEVQHYVMATNHVLAYRFLFMNNRAWNLMTKEEQKIFTTTWRKIAVQIKNEYISNEAKYISELKKKGMIFIKPDVKPFIKATEKVRQEYLTKVWGKGVYEKIKATK